MPQAYTGKDVVLALWMLALTLHILISIILLQQHIIGAFWDQLDKDTIGSGYLVGRDYVGYEVVLARNTLPWTNADTWHAYLE